MRTSVCRVPSSQHAFPGHPESPRRFDQFDVLFEGDLGETIETTHGALEHLALMRAIHAVHEEAYVQQIADAMDRAPLFLDYGDTYATRGSYNAAIDAVNGTLSVVASLEEGTINRGFALIRPPGHHANQNQAMGFCLLNNIAIAAKSLQNNGYAKVAIVDFDVHHGNGTQDIFYNDPSVLFISSHQWGIYPGTGRTDETGGPDAAGATVNIPLPAYAGDAALDLAMHQIIQPSLERFKPDVLLVSAGFDAHWSDPLANLQLSTSGYHKIAANLIEIAEALCDGRIIFVLEGGYDPEALADNVGAVLYALADSPLPEDRLGPAPIDEPNVQAALSDIQAIHSL